MNVLRSYQMTFHPPDRPAEYQGRRSLPSTLRETPMTTTESASQLQNKVIQITLVIQEVMPLPFHATESDADLQAKEMLSVAFGLFPVICSKDSKTHRLIAGQRGTYHSLCGLSCGMLEDLNSQ